MSRYDLHGYWKRRYGAGSTVVAMAGSIKHEAVVDLVASRFGDWSGESAAHEHGPARAAHWFRTRHGRPNRLI